MIVLFDADSLVYSCSYGVETEHEAMDKFDEHFQFIIGQIEEQYKVDAIVLYHGSKNNFRKEITKEYKANRKREKPEHYYALSRWVKFNYEAVSADGEEVDDLIAKDWRGYMDGGHEVCIVSIDKDYEQLPCLIYNYNIRKRGFKKISYEAARHNFWKQMITGDAADNVNYLKGKGKVFAEKHLEDATTDFSYLRRVYYLFLEKYAENARERFTECYKLLRIGEHETSEHI